MIKNDSIHKNKDKNVFSIVILVSIIFVILLLFSEVIITKQKYNIISLNKKIEQAKELQEDLKMEKAQLLSKSRLRSLAIEKNNMIPIENSQESIKNEVLE